MFRSYIMSEPPLDFEPSLGVSHGGDVPFVMQTFGITQPNYSPAVKELVEAIGDYWHEESLLLHSLEY